MLLTRDSSTYSPIERSSSSPESFTLSSEFLPLELNTYVNDPSTGSRWRLKGTLGSGSYAVVYLAQDEKTNEMFALKCLSKANLNDNHLALQRNEAVIQKALGFHPNIVTLHHSFEDADWLFLVLEYCEGQDLYFWLTESRDARDPTTGRLLSERERLEMVKQVFAQILAAVDYCHERGISHRDLKPENFIVITERGSDSVRVKLTDFGLATNEERSTDFDCGSKPYMSYECRNPIHETYSPRESDSWSIGILLINLLYHRSPWSDPHPYHCPSFAAFQRDRTGFLMRRFEGMPEKVARFLGTRVFCRVEEGRVGVKEWREWSVGLVSMLVGEGEDSIVPESGTFGSPTDAKVPMAAVAARRRNGHTRKSSWSDVFGDSDTEMDFTAPVIFNDEVAQPVGINEEGSNAAHSDADSGFGTDEDVVVGVRGVRGQQQDRKENKRTDVVGSLHGTSPPKVVICKPKPWGEHHAHAYSQDTESASAATITGSGHWTSNNQRRERLEQRRQEKMDHKLNILSSLRRGNASSVTVSTVSTIGSSNEPTFSYIEQQPHKKDGWRRDLLHSLRRGNASAVTVSTISSVGTNESLASDHPSVDLQPPRISALPRTFRPNPDQVLYFNMAFAQPPGLSLSSKKAAASTPSSVVKAKSHESLRRAGPFPSPTLPTTAPWNEELRKTGSGNKVNRSTKHSLGKMLERMVVFNRGVKIGGGGRA